MRYTFSTLCFSALFSINSFANDLEADSSKFHFSVYAGLADGGDNLATINYFNDDGDELFGDNIKAGGKVNLGASLNYQFNDSWSLQSNLGYFFDNDIADNADVNISRVVIEAVPYFHINDSFKLGIGLTYHVNPHFEADYDNISDQNIDYKNASGAVFSLGYALEQLNSWIELRYVSIEYVADSVNRNRIHQHLSNRSPLKPDASHVGLTWHYIF